MSDRIPTLPLSEGENSSNSPVVAIYQHADALVIVLAGKEYVIHDTDEASGVIIRLMQRLAGEFQCRTYSNGTVQCPNMVSIDFPTSWCCEDHRYIEED